MLLRGCVGHPGDCKNGAMTSESFSRPGAVDLSAIKQQALAGGAQGTAGPRYVTEIRSPQDFDALISLSMKHPVLVELTSPRAQGADTMSADLAALVNGMGGKLLLAHVNVDAVPQLAQALRIEAVPTVIALLGGQAAPLFQGVQPRESLTAVIDQVLQASVANGIVGKADPVGAAPEPAQGEAGAAATRPVDPRFDPAYAAMERGDFAAARAEFDRLLKETPNDSQALVGRAQAGLLARSAELDGSEPTRAAAEPDNIGAQLKAADFELVQGDPEAAFARLVEVVRRTSEEEREAVRARLVELFETVGPTDPAVLKFRRKLASALF